MNENQVSGCENMRFKDNKVIIYTDGASSGNPGPAGIGAVLRYGDQKKEISEYIGNATNNIAELKAVRAALCAMKRRDLPVRLYTDSSYVRGLLALGWKAKKNTELVEEIRNLVKQFKNIKIIKVRGHQGDADNEQADLLATSAIRNHRSKT
ncbi:MAG: ribonuclease HI [Desulfobacteraceae bacterium]|nr:ribonuclease HI [Desulfobacteraceae bacterium]MCF8094955.1 ribonuclease HI [Desulfobacteraceae bacterium]